MVQLIFRSPNLTTDCHVRPRGLDCCLMCEWGVAQLNILFMPPRPIKEVGKGTEGKCQSRQGSLVEWYVQHHSQTGANDSPTSQADNSPTSFLNLIYNFAACAVELEMKWYIWWILLTGDPGNIEAQVHATINRRFFTRLLSVSYGQYLPLNMITRHNVLVTA